MKNLRSPSLASTPVLSPGIARAALWVGLGAVARSRGIGWRPGMAGAEKPYFNSNQTKDPNDDNDVDDSFCICLLYTSPSPRDGLLSRMPSSA